MYRNLTIYILILLTVVVSCKKHGKEGISDNDKNDYELYDYYIDQYGNEGIVAAQVDYQGEESFYKYTLVLSLDETVATWGPMGVTVFHVNDYFNEDYPYGPFFGLEMNRMVESKGSEGFPAFDWCHKKNHGEKYLHSSSWLLPTANELYKIFRDGEAIDELNQHITEYGGTPIPTEIKRSNCYWSCVEDTENVLMFDDDVQANCDFDPARRAIAPTTDGRYYTDKTLWHKNNEYRVRAIKYIYFACSPANQ